MITIEICQISTSELRQYCTFNNSNVGKLRHLNRWHRRRPSVFVAVDRCILQYPLGNIARWEWWRLVIYRRSQRNRFRRTGSRRWWWPVALSACPRARIESVTTATGTTTAATTKAAGAQEYKRFGRWCGG